MRVLLFRCYINVDHYVITQIIFVMHRNYTRYSDCVHIHSSQWEVRLRMRACHTGCIVHAAASSHSLQSVGGASEDVCISYTGHSVHIVILGSVSSKPSSSSCWMYSGRRPSMQKYLQMERYTEGKNSVPPH